jgi:predicted PP-loop superfamily ATPase
MELAYARTCRAPYEKVVEAVERMSASHGFSVCEKRDIQAMLAAKGFAIAPLTIFEMLPARESAEWHDLPEVIVRCRVHVAVVDDDVSVGAIRPTALCGALLRGAVEDVMRDLDRAVVALVDDVAATSDSSST